MVYRTLELNILSAKDLKDVNLFSKMDVYAVVSLLGDPLQNQKARTHVHKDLGTNPTWNFPMKFTINETLAQQNRLTLEIKIVSDRTLAGDTIIGTVHVPLKEILDNPAAEGNTFRQQTYQVRTQSGKTKGSLNFSYKFGDKVEATAKSLPAPAMAYSPPAVGGSKQEPVMAYPAAAAGSSAAPPYPPPQYMAGHGYPPPPQAGYGYPPPQPGYGYPPPQQMGYPPQQMGIMGYPPQQMGYPPQQMGIMGYLPQQMGIMGYPPQQMGYGYPPAQQMGDPPQQMGYPPQQMGYGYPGQAGYGMGMGMGYGYPGQAGYGVLLGMGMGMGMGMGL